MKFKDMVLNTIEQLTQKRLFEYKNYIYQKKSEEQ
jgi:hypothetical protein